MSVRLACDDRQAGWTQKLLLYLACQEGESASLSSILERTDVAALEPQALFDGLALLVESGQVELLSIRRSYHLALCAPAEHAGISLRWAGPLSKADRADLAAAVASLRPSAGLMPIGHDGRDRVVPIHRRQGARAG